MVENDLKELKRVKMVVNGWNGWNPLKTIPEKTGWREETSRKTEFDGTNTHTDSWQP